MEDLKILLNENMDNIIKIIITNPFYKTNEFFKVVIEKKMENNIYFQASKYCDKKVFHENIKNDFVENIFEILSLYKNINIFCNNKTFNILQNKKGSIKINEVEKINVKENLTHNKEKNYILKENDKIDFLVYLGVMNENGKVFPTKQKKFKQINKFLEMLKDVEENLSDNSTIIDFGCGKSYLTFAIYYYFNFIKNKNVKIIGLDLKEDVVNNCNEIAKNLNYKNLEFLAIDIKDFETSDKNIDMVVSLHACDTATDFSIASGIKWNSKIILAVPCCQHEIFSQLENNKMPELLKHGILKERFSSLLTDAIRANVLEENGYETTVMEFIETEHTPKNILIRGIKKNQKQQTNSKELNKIFNVKTTLEKLLEN